MGFALPSREATRDSLRSSALQAGDPAIQRRLANRLWRAELESGILPTGYLPFLARIGALLGVLQDLDGRTIPGPEAETWRGAAFTTCARRMVAAWTTSEEWIEGRDRIDLAMYGASWPAFRGTLLRAIADINDDLWYDQESFVERLLVTEPDLVRQAQVGATPSSQLTMRVSPAERPSDRRADVLRLVIATTIETACVWLGIVERSQRVADRRPAFRVTPFGRWVGGRGPEPSGQHLGPAPLAVGANLQVLLYRPTPRRVWALTAFCEIKALDRVSTYQLTSSAVIRALASNVEIRDIVRFLESQSGQELPQTVLYTLEEWDRGYHRVWMQRAIILTPEEDADLRASDRSPGGVGTQRQRITGRYFGADPRRRRRDRAHIRTCYANASRQWLRPAGARPRAERPLADPQRSFTLELMDGATVFKTNS